MAEFFGSAFVAGIVVFAVVVFLIGTPFTLFLIAYEIEEKTSAIEKHEKSMSKTATALEEISKCITQS